MKRLNILGNELYFISEIVQKLDTYMSAVLVKGKWYLADNDR
eukprot:UN21925